jgi:cytosine/adenosine deaminase-related metal-dependent hydrolase
MDSLDLIVFNACVVTMDPDRRVLAPGYVGVHDGRIAVVGEGDPPALGPGVRTIDAGGGLCHPGLIDTHAHVAWGLVRCAVPEHLSEEEIFQLFDERMLGRVRDEDEHLGTLLACAEMAMNGTTCFADTGSALHHLAPTAEAVAEVGIRGMISTLNGDTVAEVPALSLPTDRCLTRIEEGLQRHPLGDGLAWACAGLLGMEGASDALVREAKALADRAGVPLNLHKSFGPDEVAACRARLGDRDPLEGFDDLGVLDANITLVHVNRCSAREVALLSAAGSSVCHCPAASMMYAMGGSLEGHVPALLDAGVTVALGTDSTHWGNAWDLTRAIYLAATVHKEGTRTRPSVDAEHALEMATIHGARAVGREDELGSLEPGKRADLVVHATDRPEAHPALDPIANLVFSAQSRTVDTVLVDGVEVVRGGRPTRIDLDTLLARVDRGARDLLRLLDYRLPERWSALGRPSRHP